MTRAPRAIPLRAMVLLSAGVLAAHMLVVQKTTLALASGDPMGTRVFTTRLLQIKASEAAALPPAAATRAAAAPAPRAAPVQPAGDAATPPPDPQPAAQAAEPPRMTEPVPALVPAAPASLAQASTETPAPAPSQEAAAPPSSLPRDSALAPRNYAVPGSVRLKFTASGMRGKMEYHASGELAWLHDGKTYDARLELGAFLIGSRVLSSAGRLSGDGLAPNRFSDRFRSEQAAHFDHQRARATFSSNAPDAELLPGAQDQLSVFIQLASMIAGEPVRYPIGSTITLQAVGTRSAEPWPFVVEAQEKLDLPGGTLDTLKLTRSPRRDYDQKVELWLAPTLSYLPARIRLTQANGDFIDQRWRATSGP